nr:outer sheath protein [Treponema denticola, Peptide Partial, 23 aa] [Treponema denticola]
VNFLGAVKDEPIKKGTRFYRKVA